MKLYMFATEQHVFIHFMNFPAILVQVYSPPPPPTGQTVKKIFFFFFFPWIYPFHEISCYFGSGVFLPPPPQPTHWPTVKKNFFMDLSIS